jgi:hypothetical protein
MRHGCGDGVVGELGLRLRLVWMLLGMKKRKVKAEEKRIMVCLLKMCRMKAYPEI